MWTSSRVNPLCTPANEEQSDTYVDTAPLTNPPRTSNRLWCKSPPSTRSRSSRRLGALCGFLIVQFAKLETVAHAQKTLNSSCRSAPDGRHHLGRPPSKYWWASCSVYLTTFLLLGVAPPEILDNNGERVTSQSSLHDSALFVVYNDDVRIRSEQFVRLRRRAGSRTCRVRWAARRITTSPSRGRLCWPCPARTGGGATRACTGTPSSTSLASSRRPQLLKMVLAQSALERVVAGTVHACKACKALGHGLQNCSSPGSGTPPRPLPPKWKEVVGQVAMTSNFDSHRVAREARKDNQLQWSLRHPGLRPAQLHRS